MWLNLPVVDDWSVCPSHSFAFVDFESPDEAKEALDKSNNTEVEGRTIRLEYSQNRDRGDGGRGNSGELPAWLVTCCDMHRCDENLNLLNLFEDFTIVKSWSGLCLKLALGGATFLVHSLKNGFSALPGPTKTLFVKGLSEDTTDQTLRDAFEGAVTARIVTDRETGSSKGWVGRVVNMSCETCASRDLRCSAVTVNRFTWEVEQTHS